MLSLSGLNKEVYKMLSFLISEEGFIYLLNTIFKAMLVVFYYIA
jgi:hypothetical protein